MSIRMGNNYICTPKICWISNSYFLVKLKLIFSFPFLYLFVFLVFAICAISPFYFCYKKFTKKQKNKPDGINYNIVNWLPIFHVGRIMIIYYICEVLSIYKAFYIHYLSQSSQQPCEVDSIGYCFLDEKVDIWKKSELLTSWSVLSPA